MHSIPSSLLRSAVHAYDLFAGHSPPRETALRVRQWDTWEANYSVKKETPFAYTVTRNEIYFNAKSIFFYFVFEAEPSQPVEERIYSK
jgi:hypothetical protein